MMALEGKETDGGGLLSPQVLALSQETANVAASPIGWLTSVSSPIGSGSGTDGLFLEMIGSCSGEHKMRQF